ncbi:TniB family NTP-binding protein [Klebsiella pneumoniae]|uniref:TniB family NTP-binding protein n=1 Tax=Klebsiella pneumoniae TaxID=573 RepID=UPI003F790E81
MAKQATHAQPAAGWPDQQWQVDDRREVPPHPPGQLRRRPEHIPVLVVQMPSEPSVIRFYVALLAAMGAPLRPRPRLPEMEQLALALLRKVGVRMLVIDELHNVLAGNSVNRREFLNLLRFLGNELRIPLVGVGTRDATTAITPNQLVQSSSENDIWYLS